MNFASRRPIVPSRHATVARAVESLEPRRLLAELGLSDALTLPRISFDGTPSTAYVTSYDPATDVLDLRARATSIRDEGGLSPLTPTAELHVQLRVDADGVLIGGVDGVDDFSLTQDADGPGGDAPVVLLRGEVRPGGFAADADFGGIEALFESLGGTLSGSFQNATPPQDIGLIASVDPAPFSFADGFSDLIAKGTIGAFPAPPGSGPKLGSISGFVYSDCENDGVRDGNDAGIAGVGVSLLNATGGLVATTTTDATGKYTFGDLPAGAYRVVENAGPALAGYLDGKETVGTGTATPGSIAANDRFNVTLGVGENAVDYNFGEVKPASVGGFVWLDLNDDATIDFGEDGIGGVTVTLYRQTGSSWTKVATDVTDANGQYQFLNLLPGNYKVAESQPCDLADGRESLGTVGGRSVGTASNDLFCNVALTCGDNAVNYNFGERPPTGCTVRCGQTATIGFWQNKNGQALLRALNGGANATNLGNWLAGAFPNLYGNALVNFAGKTNEYVAKYYVNNDFNVKAQQKLDAQVLAVAFAVYVTDADLAGSAASRYGFRVSEHGVGASTFNVGSNGAAFGVANKTTMRVIDLLVAADRRSFNGRLYDANHNGLTESAEQSLRNMANTVFSSINELGDI